MLNAPSPAMTYGWMGPRSSGTEMLASPAEHLIREIVGVTLGVPRTCTGASCLRLERL
jgi:hypothetical protein